MDGRKEAVMNSGGGGKSEWKGANKPPFREASPLPNQISSYRLTVLLYIVLLLLLVRSMNYILTTIPKSKFLLIIASAGSDLAVPLGLYL